MTIARGDAVALTRALVRVDSRNPSLVPDAPGEREIARMLAEVLEAWGMQVEVIEPVPGRPSVVARTASPERGGGSASPSLLLNGHLDVVGTEGMVHAPFDAQERGARLYGRGATDMKGGVAAMCAAAARAAESGVAGEVIVTAVSDEEYRSLGTRSVIERGVRADAAIVTEPTRLAIAPAHKGFAWTEIEVRGRAAHGSRYDIGVDAIRHAALILAELDRHEREVLVERTHPLLGHASMHASLIEGGAGMSTYPDRCTVQLERRTVPGERAEAALQEIEQAIAIVRSRVPALDATARLTFSQEPSDVAEDAPIVRALGDALAGAEEKVRIEGLSAWTDAALLNSAGIPAICFGPGDIALAHADEEWVDVEEIERATVVLTHLIAGWCGGRRDASAGIAGGSMPWRS